MFNQVSVSSLQRKGCGHDFVQAQKREKDCCVLHHPESGADHLLVADDDFAVLRFAENLEAFPQHVLGHATRQVVDVEHLAVVLATRKPWQQSRRQTKQNTDR